MKRQAADEAERTHRAIRWRAQVVFAVASMAGALVAGAATDYQIEQIADETVINREPTISESGLVAWSAHVKKDKQYGEDIYIYENGQRRNLTQGAMDRLSANVHPHAVGDAVIWTTTYTNRSSLSFTWNLKEVPNRDDVPGAENLDLDAAYLVQDGGGYDQDPTRQRLVSASTLTTNRDGQSKVNLGGRHPSGNNEIALWRRGGQIVRVTQDGRNDLAPAFDGDLLAWQKAKGWPFGWEIMALNGTERYQLTTNFYYDMAPQVHGKKVIWYGWDGHDFEVFIHDAEKGGITQITSNQFDDVSPVIWGDTVAWEAYPAVEADIFMWKDGVVHKLSDNIEDDFNPRIWEDQIVWQGFDGDDFEIYLYNGTNTVKLTSNIHDDVNPDIRDGIVCWMGYHENWDPEIYVWDGKEITRLTDNDYEDRDPKTAGGRITWEATEEDKSYIFLATPK